MQKGEAVNVRKPVDYGTMYMELTAILAQNLTQMDEIYAIGKTISQRSEKGAAVAAAEFLQANFPDRAGISPRNVRRMHDFYKVYENDQTLLRLAMKIGWTLNVVIMKAELTRDVRKWYLEQARHRGWTKAELQAALHTEAYSAHREETETAKPIKTQFARKLHMFKPCLFVKFRRHLRETPDFEKFPQKDRRFALFRRSAGLTVQHCIFAFPGFLCYNTFIGRDARC
jgi:predicted nuclease of restriction endonuclease-like (RecB) superfamily